MKNEVVRVRTVSLSRIARENLMNYDDGTIYHNDKKIKILVLCNYSVFNESHFLKKLLVNLKVFLLINVWWVNNILYFNNLFNLHQMYQGKTEESEYIAWGSTQLSVSCFHLCTSIPNFAQKPVYIGDEKGRVITLGQVTLKYSK